MLRRMEEYRPSEFEKVDDNDLREEFQNFYRQKRLELGDTPFSRRVINRYSDSSILELISILEEETLEKTSFYQFPGKQVYFYPSVREVRSEFNTTCAFSGGIIRWGSLYCCYRPLFDVVDSGRVYVLQKTLKLEPYYFSYLPNTMQEFDIFSQKVENYWNYLNEVVDYECLNYYFGGSVSLLELKKRRKV